MALDMNKVRRLAGNLGKHNNAIMKTLKSVVDKEYSELARKYAKQIEALYAFFGDSVVECDRNHFIRDYRINELTIPFARHLFETIKLEYSVVVDNKEFKIVFNNTDIYYITSSQNFPVTNINHNVYQNSNYSSLEIFFYREHQSMRFVKEGNIRIEKS